MRKVAAVLCVMAIGCATGAEMRPRGRRNSVKIESLEKRVATLETRNATLEAQIDKMAKEMHALYQVNVRRPVDPEQPPTPSR